MKDYIALNSEIGFHDPIKGLEWPLEKLLQWSRSMIVLLPSLEEWPSIEMLLSFKPMETNANASLADHQSTPPRNSS